MLNLIISKKVLVISVSPRRGGNSDYLCNRFIACASEILNRLNLKIEHYEEIIIPAEKEHDFCK